MDYAKKRISADDSFIVKVKMSVETGSIHTYVYSFGHHFRLSIITGIVYTSCEFAMVECCRFVVGILMIYVIVSEILVLPVSWLPSWISTAHRRPMTSQYDY